MPAGPRPQPNVVKLLRGNPGQRKINPELAPSTSASLNPPALSH
jgi:hypothetical protein